MTGHYSSLYLDLIYGPDSEIACHYGREPGRALESRLEAIYAAVASSEQQRGIVHAKIPNYCKKLYMMHLAGKKTLEREEQFIVTQFRESPALIWEDEIEILYHLESMIVLGRSALDIAAYIFGIVLLSPLGKTRVDSFHNFAKRLLTQSDASLTKLRGILECADQDEQSWYRILVGTMKGRSLRDQIIHQTIVGIDYFETSPNSEREYCHVVIGRNPILTKVPLAEFVNGLRRGVINFILRAEDAIVERHVARQQG